MRTSSEVSRKTTWQESSCSRSCERDSVISSKRPWLRRSHVTGQVAAHARVDAHELGQLEHEARRQVVYAEVAHVLEDVERLRTASATMPGDHDDVGTRLRLSATRMLWLSPMLVSPALVSFV